MTSSNIHAAKTRLSRLIELAMAGEEVIICKAGKPIARLIAYRPKQSPRRLGIWEGPGAHCR
jgi:prevent-host-death family protein